MRRVFYTHQKHHIKQLKMSQSIWMEFVDVCVCVSASARIFSIVRFLYDYAACICVRGVSVCFV